MWCLLCKRLPYPMLPLESKILQTKDNELLNDDRNIESWSSMIWLIIYLFDIYFLSLKLATCPQIRDFDFDVDVDVD